MAPIECDMNCDQFTVDIIPSKTIEAIAAIQIIANRMYNQFEREFATSLFNRLTKESREFLDLLSGIRFPGAEFFGFFVNERIYDDFDRFVEKISSYEGTDFIYLAFDKDISREEIELVKKNKDSVQDFVAELASHLCRLWLGKLEPVRTLIYDTENFKNRLLNLIREVYHDSEFNKLTNRLSGTYRQSSEDIRQKLAKKAPLELASEITGRNISADKTFRRFIFFPSYFMHEFNITAWDHDNDTFMLFYNIKANEKIDNEEIDKLLAILKPLSDHTRLRILQRLRNKPSYGKKLADDLKLSTASISRQLEQLRAMNLIKEEKSDGFKYFSLNNSEIEKLIDSIREFFSR